VIWAIVPAAGSGERAGGDRPKQYQMFAGVCLLQFTVERLLLHPSIGGAVIATSANDAMWPTIRWQSNRKIMQVVGGATRADSVHAALNALPTDTSDSHIVLVHDAARPCLRMADLSALIDVAARCEHGAILASPVVDTLKYARADQTIVHTAARENLWRALTPQAFRASLLKAALASAAQAGENVTDEAGAVERLGFSPRIVHGSADNIKITHAEDFALAEFIWSRIATEEQLALEATL
jgi:2-C-methyl-D-erythritol 4-phosphate cytidylyltransferase